MERHIRYNNLLNDVFQSGFRRQHSTVEAVLKVTKFIRLSIEDGQVTVLLLLNFSQFVMRSGGQESFVGAVTCWVPQGSVLGPLLFKPYIDDVSRVIRYCHFHIFADDLQIYHTCAVSDFQKCIDELNLDFQRGHK
jgi:hypothetical protein